MTDKPTYDELLKENNDLRWHKKYKKVYFSLITCLLILMFLAVAFTFSEYGVVAYLEASGITGGEWVELLLALFTVGYCLVYGYVIYHFLFVALSIYEDEVQEFYDHWIKTRKSMAEPKNGSKLPARSKDQKTLPTDKEPAVS